MPFEYAWKSVLTNCSEVEMENFLDAQKWHLKMKSQRESCSMCVPRFDEHTMHYVIYKCNSATCLGSCDENQCAWYVKTITCSATGRSVVFQHGDHLDSSNDPPRVKLNLAMKRFVREKTDAKVTPSRILNMMIDSYHLDSAIDYLPRVQRYSHYYRTSKLADSNNVEDMEAIIAAHPYHEALGEDTPFAYAYDVSPNGQPFITTGAEEDPFVVGFTTKSLLRNLAFAATHVLHVDGTFKLNTCNFPVVIIGVSDATRQFHPVCFFITSDLKQIQQDRILRGTIKMFRDVTGSLPELRFIMADADVAQRNALEAVIAQELPLAAPVFLMCFFHVMKNVKQYITGMSEPSRALVFKHVYRIQYSRTPDDLATRISEAQAAWLERPDCLEFQRKFRKQWLEGGFTKWMCLSSPSGYAKTNNPVEQFNKMIKRDYTLRQRINVNMLAQELLKLSKHQASRQRVFEQTSRPSADLIQRYKTLARENRLVASSWYRNSVSYLLHGGDARLVLVLQRGADYPQQRKRPGAIIDELARVSDFQMETFEQPASGWMVDVDAAICPCRTWFKFACCIHVISARVHVGLHVEGVTKKRKFAPKKTSGARGKNKRVGHALSME